MEKNIVLVVREGLVLRNDNGVATTFTGVGSVESLLAAVKSTLEDIQTNAQGLAPQFTHVYVPSLLGGLLNNLVGLYKRTGKTREGNVISAIELQLYNEVDQMLKDRSDNVRLVNIKHTRKNDLNMETLIKRSWALLDREERKLLSHARAGVIPQATAAPAGGMTPEMIAMQQQNAMMMQMMQQMMTMMPGMQMPNMNMMQQMPTSEPTTAPIVDTDTVVEGTSINIDATKIAELAGNNSSNAGTAYDPTAYDPEF